MPLTDISGYEYHQVLRQRDLSARCPSAAIVDDDDAGSDEFGAPTDDPTDLDFLDNDREAKSIVQCCGNPMMSFRDVTEVNGAVVIRHGVIAF